MGLLDIIKIYNKSVHMKKNLVCIIIGCFFILTTAMRCNDDVPYTDHAVKLENASGDSIYFAVSPWPEFLPLTPHLIFVEQPGIGMDMRVLGDGEIFDKHGINQQEGLDSIGILIFKQSTMKAFTTEELAEKNIYDKQYTFSYEDLEKIDFTVTYTGD